MRLKKPSSCEGCPLYQDGYGFVPDRYVNSEVMILAQNPGADEEAGERLVGRNGDAKILEPAPHQPLIGDTGYHLDRTWLPRAGLTRDEVSLTNAVRCRWKGTNELPGLNTALGREIVQRCMATHFKPPAETRVIMAMGDVALYAATGVNAWKEYSKIGDWRGWVLPFNPGATSYSPTSIYTPGPRDRVVLASYHLSYLNRAPWEEPTFIADWRKLGRVVRGEWPRALPRIERMAPETIPAISGFDTEYYPERNKLIRWSLAGDDRLWCVEAEDTMRGLMRAPDGAHVYSHNWIADLRYFWDMCGGQAVLEDTMYAHAVLFSDADHTLDYVGSIHQSFNRHKHLSTVNPIQYAAGDAQSCLEAGLAFERSFEADPRSKRVYRDYMLPLLPVLARYEYGSGLKLHQGRVKQSLEALNRVKDEAQRKAWAAAGWPLKMSSPQQVAKQLFGVEGLR